MCSEFFYYYTLRIIWVSDWFLWRSVLKLFNFFTVQNPLDWVLFLQVNKMYRTYFWKFSEIVIVNHLRLNRARLSFYKNLQFNAIRFRELNGPFNMCPRPACRPTTPAKPRSHGTPTAVLGDPARSSVCNSSGYLYYLRHVAIRFFKKQKKTRRYTVFKFRTLRGLWVFNFF